jgi:hypothetical protein
MASEQTVLNIMGKALWDPNPTTTDLQARQLAVVLGYPRNWRVVRSLDDGVLVDRIYSDKPGSDCDTWFNHAGAMEAAATWETSDQTPYAFRGGHLLPLQPLFDKGDKVQVFYGDTWWNAKILRRKEYPGQFKYQVFYPSDASKQSGVEEALIRHRPTEVDPEVTASALGFGEGWKAYSVGNNKWKIVSRAGETYKTKKAALEAFQAETKAAADEGDPPWRTVDNEYLGRRVKWITQHKASARRTVSLEQIGTVTGWISETDVDKEGQPGFVAEQTGKPARLYHVKFYEDPHHAYSSHFLSEQDLEEWELKASLIPEDEREPPKKKIRTR